MRKVMRVAVSGPLEDVAVGLVSYLSGLGYAPLSIASRVRLLAHLSRWLQSGHLELAAFDGDAIERFLVDRSSDHVDMSTPGALAPLLTYLRLEGLVAPAEPAYQPAKGPVDSVLDDWSVYLAQERGLQPGTIRYYRQLVRPFLLTCLQGETVELGGLDARAVSEFVRTEITGLTPAAAKLTITSLRSLLRYLFTTGLVRNRLDSVVPARAGHRDSGLPCWLGPEQVEALIAAAGSQPRTGARDVAIVLLICRLGLRAGEVAALTFEDLDWRGGTVRISGKNGQVDLMPLTSDAGTALAKHLRQRRHGAAWGRALFHCSLAPYRALEASGVKLVIRRAGVRAGLGSVGAHRLRHTVATSTLNAGASLEEVGQLLRHRSLESTAIYAKVNLIGLSSLTRPWPEPLSRPSGGGLR